MGCGRQRTTGKPRAGRHAATLSFAERVAPGTALAAHLLLTANQSSVSNVCCKAPHGLRPGCLSSYAPPKNSRVHPKAFLPTGCQSLTLLPFRMVQGIALVDVCQTSNYQDPYCSWVKQFTDGDYFRLSFMNSLI